MKKAFCATVCNDFFRVFWTLKIVFEELKAVFVEMWVCIYDFKEFWEWYSNKIFHLPRKNRLNFTGSQINLCESHCVYIIPFLNSHTQTFYIASKSNKILSKSKMEYKKLQLWKEKQKKRGIFFGYFFTCSSRVFFYRKKKFCICFIKPQMIDVVKQNLKNV